jgi:hypothetical protein
MGKDKIQVVEGTDNTYRYQEWVTDCPTTRAIAIQIARMQRATENDKDPCFRSGSATHDFAALLVALDLFWD